MGEVLTSDLLYGGNLAADAVARGEGEQPKLVRRGDPLPKDYEGPPSEDELRDMGILVDEQKLAASGGFEPEGGRKLPESAGMSISSLARRQQELRAQAIEADPDQAKLIEASEQGKRPEDVLKSSGKDKGDAELAESQQTRPETKAQPKEEPQPDEESKAGSAQS